MLLTDFFKGRGQRSAVWFWCLFAVARALAATHLSDWADFDTAVEAEYAALAASACVYPPAEVRFTVSSPPFTFDPAAFSDLTNAASPRLLAGVTAWKLRVVETQAAERVWIALAEGCSIHTNAVSPYDTQAWSRAAYGEPPVWLAGDDLARWYRERARERFELNLTLIPSDRFDEYLANIHAAATNAPAIPTGPIAPADTNRIAFARASPAPAGTFGFNVYTPADLPVDIFSKADLTDGQRWGYAGTVQALTPFTPAGVTAAPGALYLHSARGDIDTDGDGIPDGMELLHFGTNHALWDSDGDDISDWFELYHYGTNPHSGDSDGDGLADLQEVSSGLNPNKLTYLVSEADLDFRITTPTRTEKLP